jgi:hypothetical protein
VSYGGLEILFYITQNLDLSNIILLKNIIVISTENKSCSGLIKANKRVKKISL